MTDVYDRLESCGVLPVIALPDPSLAVSLAIALRDAGLPCIEITFRTDGAAAAIASIREAVPDVLVAAGTVLDMTQARAAIDAGAQLVVAPGSTDEVIDCVLAAGLPMLPGVATPTEIERNLARGIRVMKLFPAAPLGGAGYLRAVHGPYADVRFVPTGGVTEADLADYLALPNVIACGGSWMAPPASIAARNWAGIGAAAARARAIVDEVRARD